MVSIDEPVESPMNDIRRPDQMLRARDLMSAIAAAAEETGRLRRIPEKVLDAVHEARLFRMLYPRSVGGDEVEPAIYIEAVGELARATARSAGACPSQQHRALCALPRPRGGAHRFWRSAGEASELKTGNLSAVNFCSRPRPGEPPTT